MSWWNVLLNAIAQGYLWLWKHPLQRREPFTPQLCRIEEAYPAVFWSVILVVIPFRVFYGFFVLGTFWSGFWGGSALIFLCWFCPHILRYERAHPENQPNKACALELGVWKRMALWSERRLAA